MPGICHGQTDDRGMQGCRCSSYHEKKSNTFRREGRRPKMRRTRRARMTRTTPVGSSVTTSDSSDMPTCTHASAHAHAHASTQARKHPCTHARTNIYTHSLLSLGSAAETDHRILVQISRFLTFDACAISPRPAQRPSRMDNGDNNIPSLLVMHRIAEMIACSVMMAVSQAWAEAGTTKTSSQDQGSERKGTSQWEKAETKSSRVKKAVKRMLNFSRSSERCTSLDRYWLYSASTIVHAKLCMDGTQKRLHEGIQMGNESITHANNDQSYRALTNSVAVDSPYFQLAFPKEGAGLRSSPSIL